MLLIVILILIYWFMGRWTVEIARSIGEIDGADQEGGTVALVAFMLTWPIGFWLVVYWSDSISEILKSFGMVFVDFILGIKQILIGRKVS